MPFSNLWAPGDGDSWELTEWYDENLDQDFVYQCDLLEGSMFDGVKSTNHDLLEITQQFFAAFVPSFNGATNQTLDKTQNLLETAMFIANRASLTLFSPDFSRNISQDMDGRNIYTSPGIAVPKPVLPRSGVIIMSVWIGLQLLGLIYLTYYLYRVPSWSDQLDAMAMARIGASLDHRGVLPAIGPVKKQDLVTLQSVGGLIGIVERSGRRESSATGSVLPDMAVVDDSAVELQRLTSSGEGRKSVEGDTISVNLELDASGPILTADSSGGTTLPFGLKRAWHKMFASGKQPSMDDLPPPSTSLQSETSTNLPILTLLPPLSFSTLPDDDEMSISEQI
jgi:hypothetical protein